MCIFIHLSRTSFLEWNCTLLFRKVMIKNLAFGIETMEWTQACHWFSKLEIEVTSVKDAGCSGHLSNSKMYKGPSHTLLTNMSYEVYRKICSKKPENGTMEISFSITTKLLLTLLCVGQFLYNNGMTVILHPPCSPDISHCDSTPALFSSKT
jgi:hypothetical protein